MSIDISSAGLSGTSHVWSGASPAMSPTQKMANLFDQIDTSGAGSISQSQFNQAFQQLNPPASFQSAGAGAVWNQLDPTRSGRVSAQDFVAGMTAMMKSLRGGNLDSLSGANLVNQNAGRLASLGSNDSGSTFSSVA